jgi:hypothetical protein
MKGWGAVLSTVLLSNVELHLVERTRGEFAVDLGDALVVLVQMTAQNGESILVELLGTFPVLFLLFGCRFL